MKVEDPPAIIIQADVKMMEVQAAQAMAEIRNQARRHATRMAMYFDWVKPENVAARKEKAEKEAAAALELAKAMRESMGIEEDMPLPDPLPKHMQGQSLSTIKAMLRHEKYYKPVTKLDSPFKIKE